ncbi:tRNA-splicing endonuclease subunit Sen34 isoform X1 [Neodiprion lecontei]|uniref:tRNA-splicing endonuclease subunit Sen34 n=2 Tax=Neodiprion lecontei TaxID=441921 RepID=A0A6J0CFL5_NEOLC|nr:tRNA-splicing endonuclease subunit Sen34 isoform X1 [Neodiprion lecontei]XP_046597216.1 tRNA-splicing endonuclease subunit Sen34 isoform X1 [Neodiprion lecontei]
MSELIDLAWSNECAYVWSAEDWLKLRTEHRIIGELIGCLPKLPRQEVLLGLPLLLMPEEVSLMIEKNIARLVDYPSIRKQPSESFKKIFQEHRDKLYKEQEVCLRDERRKQVTLMMDKIIEGKKRKTLGVSTSKKKLRKQEVDVDTHAAMMKINIDRDVLLNEEMAKLPKLEQRDALVQTHTAYPWTADVEVKNSEWKYPSTPEEVVRYKVYKDLWEKEFYITSGEKFGGDFLAYPGDPIMFHSQMVITCRDRTEEIPISELIAHSRVGCHVRKTQVFATLSENGDSVKYQSFQWSESCIL